MISFIVPAHNEQAGLARTVSSIHTAARSVGLPYEIIVVDDASTDATAEVARQNQATVLPVQHRQISATRNSGGRAAAGDRLFFVDADTLIDARTVASALRQMDQGAAGGGASTRLEGPVPLYARLLMFLFFVGSKVADLTGGACMYCTREAFLAVGGFDESLFGGEEVAMAFALKRRGPFVVLWHRVLTSGRRFRSMGGLQLLFSLLRMGWMPSRTLRRRGPVEKIWYNSNRQNDNRTDLPLAHRVSDFLALALLLLLVAAPLVRFVPWPKSFWESPLGALRMVAAVFLSHLGLILWPFAYFLFRSLLQQKRWAARLKITALIAYCLWSGRDSTLAVISLWRSFFGWLAGVI